VIKAQAGEQAGAAIRSIEFRNHAIRYLATPGVPVPVAPCYCRVGDRVVVGLSPIHLKDYLLFLDGNEPSILERPGYKAMAGVVPAEATSISYSDFAEAVVGTYQTFGPMLTMAQGIPRNPIAIDLANMPAARTVRKHLFGALSYTVTTDDMVVYQCESPVGVGFVGGVPTVAMAAIGAGMLLPALASARGAARGAVSMNNLKQVGVAAMMYANDHDNQLPPNLAALFDGNLLPDDKILLAPNDRAPPRTVGNRPCSYVYLLDRHKGLKLKLADIERPAMVPLAWERESFGRGRRNVLFIDGHVQAMQEADFARRMERVQNFLAKKAKEQKGEF